MRTRPRPDSLKLVTSYRGEKVHLGFEIGNAGKLRFLCHAKTENVRGGYKQVFDEKMDCKYCKIRLKVIYKHIKKFGVEWVCDGIFLPMEQRNFKNECSVYQL